MNRFIRYILNAERRMFHPLHVRGLPLGRRIVKGHRHVTAVGLGGMICLVGSFMATHAEFIMPHYMPHFVWDALAYSVHGFGLIPVCAHAEPLWDLITAE